jgi:hypothetical protein
MLTAVMFKTDDHLSDVYTRFHYSDSYNCNNLKTA